MHNKHMDVQYKYKHCYFLILWARDQQILLNVLWLNFSPLQKDMSFVHQSQNNQGYWLSYISSKLLHLGAHTLISKPASVRKVAKMLKIWVLLHVTPILMDCCVILLQR